jgi:predicted membrane protein
MDETNEKMEQTVQKYLLLMNMIGITEDRLVRSEMVYLIVNIFIFFTSTISLNILKPFGSSYFYLSTYFFLFWFVIGMFVCILWIASAMRLQLKLNIESPDKKELLQYPVKGLTRMDGFIGAAKPRHLTWILPSVFFIVYLLTFISVVLFDMIGV